MSRQAKVKDETESVNLGLYPWNRKRLALHALHTGQTMAQVVNGLIEECLPSYTITIGKPKNKGGAA